ncbi:amino acid/polyamine/organocation transporter (APC superfamily) [Sinobacterium caligoides]|uniref:Amino acid/polyamine/organocation transporter (APC superfamily) n=1 Tax=Sinobacterium caligoides TaxID=933926 RepID=A0A3N2DNV5_9GAMM|nr:APC family permease [Sinobacterium caligoides]ROS01498.1 amino acid/polyamine/organocation transporter (APC superfamily) [Sinobacterium caligoides]
MSTSTAKKPTASLKTKDILALAFGAMIGWGWVVLAGGWLLQAGVVGTLLAFLVGGAVVIMIGLVYAEMASAMPENGGEHVYSYRALGRKPAFICTWAIIFGYVSVVAFEAVALPTVVDYILPSYSVGYLWTIAGWDVYFSWVMVGVIGSIAMTWINYIGVQTAALLQKTVTLLILVAGVMLITGSFFQGSIATIESPLPNGFGGTFSVLLMIPFLFIGFDVIPQAAGEMDVPKKKIGQLLVISVVVAILWYMFLSLAVAMVLDTEALKGSSLAVADTMREIVGAEWGRTLIVFAGIAGIITSWNAFFIGGSRAIYALAESGDLPACFAKLHPKYKTPTNAILLIGAFSTLAPLMGRQSLVWLVNASGVGIIIAYIFVVYSFIVLRNKEPEMERPFKVAYGKAVAWLALACSAGMLLLYMPFSPSALSAKEWAMVAAWFGLGGLLLALNKESKKHSEVAASRITQTTASE